MPILDVYLAGTSGDLNLACKSKRLEMKQVVMPRRRDFALLRTIQTCCFSQPRDAQPWLLRSLSRSGPVWRLGWPSVRSITRTRR